MQELLYFAIEGGSADDYLIEIASEGLVKLFAHAFPDFMVDDRHVHQDLHAWCLQLRQDNLLDDFLYDKGNTDNDVGFYFAKGIEDDFRRWMRVRK